MVPYYTILIFAMIGAFNNGIIGFIIWGCISHLSVIILSYFLQKINGGIVPKKIRDETATDFIEVNSDLIKATYPDMSLYQVKELVASMLDNIVRKALTIDPSLKAYPSPHMFFLAALEIVEEQPTEPEKKMAKFFVEFLRTHKFWKIKYKDSISKKCHFYIINKMKIIRANQVLVDSDNFLKHLEEITQEINCLMHEQFHETNKRSLITLLKTNDELKRLTASHLERLKDILKKARWWNKRTIEGYIKDIRQQIWLIEQGIQILKVRYQSDV